MRLRLNLQQKILLLVAGSMSLILLASSYLHSGRIRSLIEKDHYDNAVNQTVALGNRIAQYDYFSNLDDLQQEMQLVVSSRPDFRQIDVYENQANCPATNCHDCFRHQRSSVRVGLRRVQQLKPRNVN